MKEKLLETTNKLIRWGSEIVATENNEKELEKNLVALYQICLSVEKSFDETDYPEAPEIDEETIREMLSENFPAYGYYLTVDNLTEMENEPEVLAGDSIDDLTDIVKDLLEVKWRIENTSEADAIWNLKFQFDTHLGNSLVELLNYIRRK